jgi:poly(3-hydroxybutyrate) depolymerase
MARSVLLILIFILSLASAGFAQKVTKTFTIKGTTHSCVWYVPTGINNPPVVFFIHGAKGWGTEFEGTTKGDAVADKGKFIAVYPSAYKIDSSGVWNDMSGITNFPFFLAVIDTLNKRYTIDRSRIYMTGFSQGGFISFVAGCNYSDIFAAIAPVSGHSGTSCTIKRPVPVYLTFGANEDKTAFVNDLKVWLKLDSCPSTPVITHPYPSSNPQSKVTRVAYGPCAQGTYVIMDSISGQNHQWPSVSNLNQAEDIWSFFKQFSLNTSTAVRNVHNVSMNTSLKAQFISGAIRLTGVKKECRVNITDFRGRQIVDQIVKNGEIPFKNRPDGIYVVTVKGSVHTGSTRILIP